MAYDTAMEQQPFPTVSGGESISSQGPSEVSQAAAAAPEEEEAGIRLLYYWHVVLKH